MEFKKVKFLNIDVSDNFFDSLKEDYHLFEKWFSKKKNDYAYICLDNNNLVGFLYLKIEYNEIEEGIIPALYNNKKLKIGTFKVSKEGFGIGKKFMDIVITESLKNNVDEIYLTVYDKNEGHRRFINFIKKNSFYFYGYKNGTEKVFIRNI